MTPETCQSPDSISSKPGSNGDQAVNGPSFQERVKPWMMVCFGEEISNDRVERGDRLLEEVFELLQSGGYDPARVLPLRDYVWSREVGEPSQEAGGVQVTMAAYCLAHGLDMHEAGETELARIWTKVEKIRAKQAAKPKHSPLPVPASEPEPVAWREIDLSKAVKSNHPDISTDKQYLVKVYGRWHFGQFTCQWYGLNFNGWGNSGCQFDAPGYNSSGWERVIEIDPEALAKPVPTPDGAVAVSMTPEEHRLEDLKQMAAYSGPIVSFECREPYYLASCDHCGWVGSSELCGTDSFGDDSDVYCPRCHSSGADCGKVAESLSAALSHPADGWRDIESAPKDGTEILLYGPPCTYNGKDYPARVTSGSWQEWEETENYEAGASWVSFDGGFLEELPPTMWHPLPAAPLDAKAERE